MKIVKYTMKWFFKPYIVTIIDFENLSLIYYTSFCLKIAEFVTPNLLKTVNFEKSFNALLDVYVYIILAGFSMIYFLSQILDF